MGYYSVAIIKDTLSSLIDKALAGEEVIMTRHGKPMVALSAVNARAAPTPEERSAVYERLRKLRASRPASPISSADMIRQMRDEGIG